MTPAQPLWTAAQVAALLSMSKQWVYKEADLGRLPCVRFGASVRFRPEVVRAFMEAREQGLKLLRAVPSSPAHDPR